MKSKLVLCFLLATILCSDLQLFVSEGLNNDEYCFQTLADGCQGCFMSFLNDDQCQLPRSQIKNCIRYRDANNCSMCQLGLELVDNECVNMDKPDYCIRKNLVGQCNLCSNNKYVDTENNCTKQCTINDCDICEYDYLLNHEKCYLCKSGYVAHLQDDGEKQTYICIKDTKIPNCWVSRPNFTDKCYKCKINYYENDLGQCVKSSKYNTNLMNGIKRFLISIVLTFLL